MTVSIFQGCTETCGWMAAVLAVVAWGSFGVPLKLANRNHVGNNNNNNIEVNCLVMQTYKTCTCFATCWCVLLLGERVQFSHWGLASGLFWVPAATCGVYAIRNAGLAIAVGTWSSIQVLTSFVFGIVIFQERVKSLPRTCLAFVTLTMGLVGMSRYAGMGSSNNSVVPASAAVISKNAAAAVAVDHGTTTGSATMSRSTKSPARASSINRSSSKPSLADGHMIASGERERASLVRKSVKPKKKIRIALSYDRPTNSNIPTLEKRKINKIPFVGNRSSGPLFVVGIDDVKKLTPISSPKGIVVAATNNGASSFIRIPFDMEASSSFSTAGGGGGGVNDVTGSSNHDPHHQRLLDDFDDPYGSGDDENGYDRSRRKQGDVAGVFFGGRILLSRRQMGVLGAVINGAWGGCNLIPMHYAKRDDGLSGASYLISYACGSMIVNIVIWVLLFLYFWHQRNGHVQEAIEALPRFHFQHLWFPGLCTGLLYSVGNFCSILAVTYLGQGTGFSFCQMNLLVGGLWAVFYFHEIQGAECITKWFMSAAVALTGIIWLSYEHEAGGASGHR